MITRTLPIGRRLRRGFTLLEILVVLSIIGLLFGMAVPVYSKLVPRLNILSATHQLLADLRTAHNAAISEQRPITITFLPADNSYILFSKKHVSAATFSIKKTEENAGQTGNNFSLNFYPDGSANPSLITLADSNFSTKIEINGLTGEAIVDGQ